MRRARAVGYAAFGLMPVGVVLFLMPVGVVLFLMLGGFGVDPYPGPGGDRHGGTSVGERMLMAFAPALLASVAAAVAYVRLPAQERAEARVARAALLFLLLLVAAVLAVFVAAMRSMGDA